MKFLILKGGGILFGLLLSWSLLEIVADEPIVVEIRVDGLVSLSREFVLGRIATRVGAPWDPQAAARDLDRLYQTDRFKRAQIRSEILPEGIRVLIEVEEAPRLLRVLFEGLNQLKRRDLIEGIQELGIPDIPEEAQGVWLRPLSDALLSDLVEATEEAARRRNFAEVEVTPRIEPREDGVDLVLRLNESQKIYVDDFEIKSEANFSQSFIKRNVNLQTREKFWIFQKGIFDPQLLSGDILQVIQFFQDRGYLDVTVDAVVTRTSVEPSWLDKIFEVGPQDAIEIELQVREGPLYSWGQINIEGFTIFDEDQIRQAFDVSSGQIVDTRKLFRARDQLADLYGSKGYVVEDRIPDPILTSIFIRRQPDARTCTVDLEVVIREGQPITLRDLIIRGNERTRDEVIRREIQGILPGTRYDASVQRESLRRLRNLNYFQAETLSLDISPDFGQTQRDVIVDVDETETGDFNFGVAFSSEGDFNANLELNQRNFDVTDIAGFPFNTLDFFRNRQYVGKGQNFSLQLSPGTRRSNYLFRLFEPWFFGYPLGVGFTASFRTDDFDEFEQERLTFSLEVSKRWFLGPQKLLTAGVRFRQEEVALMNIEDDAPSFIRDSDREIMVIGVTPFLSFDSRDNIRFTTEGQLHNLSVERAGGIWGGLDFTRISQNSFFFFSPYTNREDERHVVSISSQFDWIEPFDRTGNIPITERYFLGGLRTLRGYEFAAIGPRENDVALGGSTRHYGSLEYIVPLAGRTVRGVAFFDYGTLHFFPTPNFFNGYRFSLGLGVRLIIPGVGFPLSVEVAEPVGPKSNREDRQFFNFSLVSRTSF